MPRSLKAAAVLVLALLLHGASSSPAVALAPPDTLVLDAASAMERALSVSPEVGSVAAGRQFAAARLRFARASRIAPEFSAQTAHAAAPGLDIPNPELDDEALYLDPLVRNDWEDLRPFNRLEVSLGQPVYTWGELGGSIRAARHGVEVEEGAVREKALEVALRTGELYYGLLLTEELFRLVDRTGEVLRQAQQEIQRLLDEGAADVDDADLFQVEITEQEYLRRVVEVTQRRQTARSALARQLLLPENVVVMPENTVLAPLPFERDSLATYFAVALQSRPELEQAVAGVAAREALVEVARSGYFPKLYAGVEARYSYAEGRHRQRNPFVSDPYLSRTVRAGLSLRQNLNFVRTKAEVEQAEAERNEVVFQRQAAEQLVLFEVEEAYRDLIVAQAALEAQDRALTISKEWLQTEYINFDLDLGDTENLVDAVRASLQLEASYFEAVRQYNVAVLSLLDAVGVLTRSVEDGTLVDL